MCHPKKIHAPFENETAKSLVSGEWVLISGKIIAARDAAHKKMVEALDRGETLPVDLKGQVIYYVGPSPAQPGHIVGSAGPTTSGRMDSYTPRLLANGLKGMIGKGPRNREVCQAIVEYGAPCLAAVGGAGALLAKTVKKYRVLAWPELGPEALAEMEVKNFPAIVVIDANGANYYDIGRKPWRKQTMGEFKTSA